MCDANVYDNVTSTHERPKLYKWADYKGKFAKLGECIHRLVHGWVLDVFSWRCSGCLLHLCATERGKERVGQGDCKGVGTY